MFLSSKTMKGKDKSCKTIQECGQIRQRVQGKQSTKLVGTHLRTQTKRNPFTSKKVNQLLAKGPQKQ